MVEQKAKNCQFGNHTFCFLNIEGSFKTNSCRSPGTIKNHWWTWSVLPITWFVKWLKNVTWFVNLRKFNPWFEIQTHPSSSVFNRSFYQINKDQFFLVLFWIVRSHIIFHQRKRNLKRLKKLWHDFWYLYKTLLTLFKPGRFFSPPRPLDLGNDYYIILCNLGDCIMSSFEVIKGGPPKSPPGRRKK